MLNDKKIKLEAAEKINIEVMDKLLKIHENNIIIDPIEFEKYFNDLYEKNLKEILKKQK